MLRTFVPAFGAELAPNLQVLVIVTESPSASTLFLMHHHLIRSGWRLVARPFMATFGARKARRPDTSDRMRRGQLGSSFIVEFLRSDCVSVSRARPLHTRDGEVKHIGVSSPFIVRHAHQTQSVNGPARRGKRRLPIPKRTHRTAVCPTLAAGNGITRTALAWAVRTSRSPSIASNVGVSDHFQPLALCTSETRGFER